MVAGYNRARVCGCIRTMRDQRTSRLSLRFLRRTICRPRDPPEPRNEERDPRIRSEAGADEESTPEVGGREFVVDVRGEAGLRRARSERLLVRLDDPLRGGVAQVDRRYRLVMSCFAVFR